MPLKGLLSRPSTSSGHRTQSYRTESAESSSTNKTDATRKRTGSLKRLSLSFVPSLDSNFHHFLTTEPEEIRSRENSMDKGTDLLKTESRKETPQTETPNIPETIVESKIESQPKDEEQKIRPQRFSLMKFRNASEPLLSTKYKNSAPVATQEVAPPQIITTAPTQHHDPPPTRSTVDRLFPRSLSPFRRSQIIFDRTNSSDGKKRALRHLESDIASTPNLHQQDEKMHSIDENLSVSGLTSPPAYGDESTSALAIPLSRTSDSSRSEGSVGDHKLYAQTTTTHTISTTTTFFKLKRKSKDKGPLFPLPERLPRPASARNSISQVAGESIFGRKSISPSRKSTQAVRFDTAQQGASSSQPSPSHSVLALTNAPLGTPGPAIVRKYSTLSNTSNASSPSITVVPPKLGARGRSSTMGSLGRSVEKLSETASQISIPARTSTSTSGRRSFGDLLSISHRLRQNSAPPRHGPAASPSTPGSKSNSLQIARESEPELVYPERDEADTPATYLEKLEATVPKGAMATILCKGGDDFLKTCLRKYMRGFSYFGESIDMAIRKMLMEVILPKETQQIDRLLAGFADRYHECNPGIFLSADEANFVAFSILLLHSDNHNKSNKRKMTKQDYIKNTQHSGISVADDVLECFYDNTCYTPFIHFEDEVAVNTHRLTAPKAKKTLIRTKSSENLRGPVDPYALLLDNKLDALRPSLKDVIETEETYSSSGTAGQTNTKESYKAFSNAATLQIISARSRPDAFMNQATITNPSEAQHGIVSIKIAKVGLLWRKSAKKKKAKSPWQEWGAILTDSKLYFFKEAGWVRRMISQYESHSKVPGKAPPLIFKPPLPSFDPDAWMAMDDAVALLDSSYTKHKYAFTFIKHGGLEEVFLANSESDMNDWIGKLNYAATFRSAGVRMRGLVGTGYEDKAMARKDSSVSTKTFESTVSELLTQQTSEQSTSPQMAWEIMYYRRQLIGEKLSAFEDHFTAAQKELDHLQRNARHLLILLPIQQKSRDALVLAAGRMNAKLKWIRKEIWRTKTHRDILVHDLEAESASSFPIPGNKITNPSTPPKATFNQLATVSPDDHPTATPVTEPPPPQGRRPSQDILDQIKIETKPPPEMSIGRRRSTNSFTPMSPKPSLLSTDDHFSPRSERTLELYSIPTQSSGVSSSMGHDRRGLNGSEEYMSRDARTFTKDGPLSHGKRRGSDPEKDRATIGTTKSEISRKDRAGSVRRSLHRTLRETYQSPAHHRSRRGKESGSSVSYPDDGLRPVSGDIEELKRDPTGRFVLHGKKASVITMSPEWQMMSNEERKILDEQVVEEKNHEDGTFSTDAAIAFGNGRRSKSTVSLQSEVTGLGETFHSAQSSRRPSTESGSDAGSVTQTEDSREVGDASQSVASLVK